MQLAGHCGDESDLLATGWQDWYRSVETAFKQLRKRCSTIFAGGLSMGAVLALHLGARWPGEVAGLALYSTTLKYDGWAVPKLSFLLPLILRFPLGRRYRFVETYPFGIKDRRLRNRVVASMLDGRSGKAGLASTPGLSLRELWRLVAEVKRELSSIRTPTLILHSDNDDIASLWNAEHIVRHHGGQTRKIILDDCYHMITVDKQREEVVKHTADFFRSLESASEGQDEEFRTARGDAPSRAGRKYSP